MLPITWFYVELPCNSVFDLPHACMKAQGLLWADGARSRAEGKWSQSKNRADSDPGTPAFEVAFGRATLDPSTTSRRGNALVPHGRTARRARLDPMRPVPGGYWTRQVSRHETLAKPDHASIVYELPCGCIDHCGSAPQLFAATLQTLVDPSDLTSSYPNGRSTSTSIFRCYCAAPMSVPSL